MRANEALNLVVGGGAVILAGAVALPRDLIWQPFVFVVLICGLVAFLRGTAGVIMLAGRNSPLRVSKTTTGVAVDLRSRGAQAPEPELPAAPAHPTKPLDHFEVQELLISGQSIQREWAAPYTASAVHPRPGDTEAGAAGWVAEWEARVEAALADRPSDIDSFTRPVETALAASGDWRQRLSLRLLVKVERLQPILQRRRDEGGT